MREGGLGGGRERGGAGFAERREAVNKGVVEEQQNHTKRAEALCAVDIHGGYVFCGVDIQPLPPGGFGKGKKRHGGTHKISERAQDTDAKDISGVDQDIEDSRGIGHIGDRTAFRTAL